MIQLCTSSGYFWYLLCTSSRSKQLFELRCLCGFHGRSVPSVRLSEKKLFNGCTHQKMLVYKVVTFIKRIKMAILFFDFFGSDPSKMDQTCKFGEQTSQILEFKPKGLDFYLNTHNNKIIYDLFLRIQCYLL